MAMHFNVAGIQMNTREFSGRYPFTCATSQRETPRNLPGVAPLLVQAPSSKAQCSEPHLRKLLPCEYQVTCDPPSPLQRKRTITASKAPIRGFVRPNKVGFTLDT